jgi:hypothetical protein
MQLHTSSLGASLVLVGVFASLQKKPAGTENVAGRKKLSRGQDTRRKTQVVSKECVVNERGAALTLLRLAELA